MAHLSPNEIEAFKIMTNAIEALRSQYEIPRYARDRLPELQDFAKLVCCGLQTLIREADGDDAYLDVKAFTDDIKTCLADVIEAEEGREVPDYRARLQRHYGTHNHAQQGIGR